ncbi:MAG: tetratricopeptide repeat protein [Bacteroidales bacterium]|jgi:tetratricopeptide (TPR) repeat protein
MQSQVNYSTVYYYEILYSKNQGNQYVVFKLGTLYGQYKNDLDKSIFYLEKSISLNSNDVITLTNLGVAYGIQKRYDKSVNVLEAAYKIDPNSLNIINNLALTYKLLGNKEKAQYFDNRAIALKNKKK